MRETVQLQAGQQGLMYSEVFNKTCYFSFGKLVLMGMILIPPELITVILIFSSSGSTWRSQDYFALNSDNFVSGHVNSTYIIAPVTSTTYKKMASVEASLTIRIAMSLLEYVQRSNRFL